MSPLGGIEGLIELWVGWVLMKLFHHASERAMSFMGSKEGIWGCLKKDKSKQVGLVRDEAESKLTD
jgi:hypothetical protein